MRPVLAFSGSTLQYAHSRHTHRHHKERTGITPTRLAAVGSRIIGTVHDEIILEVPEEKTEEAAAILKNVMEAAGLRYLKQVPVLAEPIIADSWADK
jgi:DNA polymerase I